MRPQDRLAFIVFDDVTEVQFDFLEMSEDIQGIATEIIEALHGRGSTNAYQALDTAMKLVEARDDKSRNASILFFTDGIPNISP